jgi:hypothetical protein
MLSKVVVMLAVTSIAAFAMRCWIDADSEDRLARETREQLDALRAHLFRG